MYNIATDHSHIGECLSDMEMKRKSLFYNNNKRFKNKISLKNVVLDQFFEAKFENQTYAQFLAGVPM